MTFKNTKGAAFGHKRLTFINARGTVFGHIKDDVHNCKR
jgi:hypothetical protein